MTGAVTIDALRASGHVVAIPDAARAHPAAGSVRFEGLGKTYHSGGGDVRALDGIDLDIRPGEIFGIIGRSGAGKSSLIRTINRLERPTTGRVLVDGRDIGDLSESGLVALRRRIGMIFQHFNLLAAKTVRDNVALPLRVAGIPRSEINTRVAEALELVGLADKGDTYPSRLSGGQKQRVGIARALVSRPEILLCDEATSALDPETTLSILTLLRDINARLGLTIVLITHEMAVIREICDRVLVLEGGRIAETGPVWQVFGAPRHPATQALLAPLLKNLPGDLATRLRADRHGPRDEVILELRFAGVTRPDLGALAQALGTRGRLLTADIDSIQGRQVGRVLVAAPADADLVPLAHLSDHRKVLGHVDPAND